MRIDVRIVLTLVAASGLSCASTKAFEWSRDGNEVTDDGGGPSPAPKTFAEINLTEDTSEDSSRASVVLRPEAAPIPDAVADSLLSRLPAIHDDPPVSFAVRPGTPPPQRIGPIVRLAFPPPEEERRGKPARRRIPSRQGPVLPLQVLRMLPEGEIEHDARVEITFSEAMVPLGDPDSLAAGPVPARLDPEPPGRWRWQGTRTLVFEANPRFPMATAFRVIVPAGVRARNGAVLEAPEVRRFRTAPPIVMRSWPEGEGESRRPEMVVSFNGRVNPDSVLPYITIHADVIHRVERIPDAEVAARPSHIPFCLMAGPPAGYSVAFRPVDDLPVDTQCEVQIAPNVPSAEGPLRNPLLQTYLFKTYGPLEARAESCASDAPCTSGSRLRIAFNNALDDSSRSDDRIHVTPAVPEMKVEWSASRCSVGGKLRPGTQYEINVDPGVRDIFGQTLRGAHVFHFEVKAGPPELRSSHSLTEILDPGSQKVHAVWAANIPRIRCRLTRVGPEQWITYKDYLFKLHAQDENGEFRADPGDPPGTLVVDTTITVAGGADEFHQVPMDLRPALIQGFGQCLLRVDPLVSPKVARRLCYVVWIQSTGIGLDAAAADSHLVVRTTRLDDGRPLPDVQVSLHSGGTPPGALPFPGPAVTNEDGVTTLQLDEVARPLLVARRGADVALLPAEITGSFFQRADPSPIYHQAFATADRGVYRPGDDLVFKGWLRQRNGKGAPIALPEGIDSVAYVLRSGDAHFEKGGVLPLTGLGGFEGRLTIPEEFPPGWARISFDRTRTKSSPYDHGWGEIQFSVQEFRRPEFTTKVLADPGPWRLGDAVPVRLETRLFTGGVLAGIDVDWNVSASPTWYVPPNWGLYRFGDDDRMHWLRYWDYADSWKPLRGTTTSDGIDRLLIEVRRAAAPVPLLVSARAVAHDFNRQALSAETTFIVHPSDVCLGLRTFGRYHEAGKPVAFGVIVTDFDGRPVPGRPIVSRWVRFEERTVDGRREKRELDAMSRSLSSAGKPRELSFPARVPGDYLLTVETRDASGRLTCASQRVHVDGEPPKLGPAGTVTLRPLDLQVDPEECRPGDTVELTVHSPVVPGHGVLFVMARGIDQTLTFEMTEATKVLRIPVPLEWPEEVSFRVVVTGRSEDKGNVLKTPVRRFLVPAEATAEKSVSVNKDIRRLEIAVATGRPIVEPGDTTSIQVVVRNHDGRPERGAEVAVFVSDESILSLTNYRFENPLSFFQLDHVRVAAYGLRSLVVLQGARQDGELNYRGGRENMVASLAFSPSMAGIDISSTDSQFAALSLSDVQVGRVRMGAPMGFPTPRLRQDFTPLALFAGAVRTDSSGTARVSFRLPDNLTRYRVTALAAAGPDRFGLGESNLTAKLPLMVRPSAPRFVNAGDRFELPLIVENTSDAAMNAVVAVRASNAIFEKGRGRSLAIPPHRRAEVRVPCAPKGPGRIHAQVLVAADRASDASELVIPVWTPMTAEAFATYGQVDSGAVSCNVMPPGATYPQYGGLEVSTSSTALQELTDAFVYLRAYPYECAEQMASRVLAAAALRDVLRAFHAQGLPDSIALVRSMEQDIDAIAKLQTSEGGFSFWPGRSSYPWLGVYVPHALAVAREKGFRVPEGVLEESEKYLENIRFHIPSTYPRECAISLQAFALFVRGELDEVTASEIEAFVDSVGLSRLEPEPLAWVLSAASRQPEARRLTKDLERRLLGQLTEDAAFAHAVTGTAESDALLLRSDSRSDAVVLDALVSSGGADDLLPKLVRSLLGERRRGRWMTTQENVFALTALDHYFRKAEAAVPDFRAACWVGDAYAGSFSYRGRTTERQEVDVPMRDLVRLAGGDGAASKKNLDLTIEKTGPGRLYYRMGLRWAPLATEVRPKDQGFRVERIYHPIDNAADVHRNDDGSWTIRPGARVSIEVRMITNVVRYHVALVDPLPGGFEPLNPTLVGTQADDAPGYHDEWWFEHQNLRDERAEAFTSVLNEGTYTFSYLARATTPGEFTAAPPRAEEMYNPETWGRGKTDLVIIR